jgi:hypothetical protein
LDQAYLARSPIQTTADATKAILGLLQAASKVLAGSGGLVRKSIAFRRLFLAGLLDQHIDYPTAQGHTCLAGRKTASADTHSFAT